MANIFLNLKFILLNIIRIVFPSFSILFIKYKILLYLLYIIIYLSRDTEKTIKVERKKLVENDKIMALINIHSNNVSPSIEKKVFIASYESIIETN